MKTMYMIALLLAGTAQAQTVPNGQLIKAVNGSASNENRTVFSSQNISPAMATRAKPAAAKSFGNSVRFLYSNANQVGTLGGGDFQKIQQSAIEIGYEWPGLIEDAVREGLKDLARRTGHNENLFLTTDNLNTNINRIRALPEWQDLITTANALEAVWNTTPTFKEAGGFSTGLQFKASSPLINPNGTPNYSRIITSFPFTVR